MTVVVDCIGLAMQLSFEVDLLALFLSDNVTLWLHQIIEHIYFSTANVIYAFDELKISLNGQLLAFQLTELYRVSLLVAQSLEMRELVVAIFDWF